MAPLPLTAVIWDFDGTLVDTRQRNFSVVRRLMADVTGRPADDIPALTTLAHYSMVNRQYVNWRDLYRHEFGFSETETDRVGMLWSEYQLSDDTPAAPFDGIPDVLDALGAVPHGIVSQNAKDQIERALEQAALAEHFGFVIGYDGVPLDRQKPAPDGLVACICTLAITKPTSAVHRTHTMYSRRAACRSRSRAWRPHSSIRTNAQAGRPSPTSSRACLTTSSPSPRGTGVHDPRPSNATFPSDRGTSLTAARHSTYHRGPPRQR
jgi:beta-phosphoglucomutase-like phosphatase (HAD superfamily)